jgi:hypothetical protein
MGDTVKTNSQRKHDAAIQASRDDRARMLKAMAALEASLASGAVSRQMAWQKRVVAALGVLEVAMEAQTKELKSGEGVLAGILERAPRFERQVRQLRDQYADLARQIKSLREQFTNVDDEELPEVGDIRQRLAWLITAIRHFQARESDLLQEAFCVDIGVGD